MNALTRNVILFLACLSFTVSLKAQCTAIPELVFKNPVLLPGSNTVYRFPHVNSTADALVSIHASYNASLIHIDGNRSGVDNAFQPKINLDNQHSNGTEGYIDFLIEFVQSGTETPITMPPFVVSAVDIDGDGYRLRESVGFGDFGSFTVDGIYSAINYSSVPGSNMMSFETSNYQDLAGIATHTSSNSVLFDYTGDNSIIIRAKIIDDGEVLPSKAHRRQFSFNFDPCLINCYGNPITLPVEYNYFDVQKLGTEVELKWETALEINNERFEIERSIDGAEFEYLGTVQGYGNSEEAQIYQFIDSRPLFGKMAYRLKQIDFDGAYSYSQVQEVFFSVNPAKVSMNLYPNPTADYLHISSNGDISQAWIKIWNPEGQVMLHQKMHAGINQLSLQHLASGLYMVELQSEDLVLASQKIVKR